MATDFFLFFHNRFAALGREIGFIKKHDCRSPVMTLTRSDNAFLLSAFTHDTTTV